MANRMLFGDDGSSSADSAWLWVTSHRWPGWRIEVLAVGEAVPAYQRELPASDQAAGVDQLHLPGKPADRLRERGVDSDLIVIGAKGHGWRKVLHLGSTAENLMHSPPAPTMIIRGGHRTRRLLLALDGSDHARATEEDVARLPWIDSVEIGIIGIREEGKAPRAVWEAEKRLTAVAKCVTGQVVGPDELQAFYRPSDIILDAAKKWNADIVALGSRGLSRWESVGEKGLRRAGSCAIAVAQAAPCSVMLGQVQA